MIEGLGDTEKEQRASVGAGMDGYLQNSPRKNMNNLIVHRFREAGVAGVVP